MPSVQEKPVIRIAPNNPVFDLPVIVGIEEGLFEAVGLDVRFSATYADREKDRADIEAGRLEQPFFNADDDRQVEHRIIRRNPDDRLFLNGWHDVPPDGASRTSDDNAT